MLILSLSELHPPKKRSIKVINFKYYLLLYKFQLHMHGMIVLSQYISISWMC